MTRAGFIHSVVARLVACMLLGAVVLSAGLGWLEYYRLRDLMQIDMAQSTVLTVRNLQVALASTPAQDRERTIRDIMMRHLRGGYIRAARVTDKNGNIIGAGDWPETVPADLLIWAVPVYETAQDTEMSLARMTLVRSSLSGTSGMMEMELLVDGPSAARKLRHELVETVLFQMLLMAVMLLMGLFLLRQWVSRPLIDMVGAMRQGRGAERFYELAGRGVGEFQVMAETIGGMLTRINATAQRLYQREQAFEDLFQFIPVAILAIDTQGKIVDANRRAATLLGDGHEKNIISKPLLEFVCAEDKACFRQTLDRLELETTARCEIRLQSGVRTVHVALECTGVRDQDGVLCQVRLTLADVTQMRKLQAELTEKGRLWNLVIDHMSDAVLLVDTQQRILAYNQKLAAMLKCRSEQWVGRTYDPEHFWEELGLYNVEMFARRLKQIETEQTRPAQERFDTQMGVFAFEGIPVHGAQGALMGRLWVVRDISHQEQSHRLAARQNAQLQTLRQLGQRLADASTLDELMEASIEVLYETMGVESIGMALRSDQPKSRMKQLIHRGPAAMPLDLGREMTVAIEKELVPGVMTQRDVMYWVEPPHGEGWGRLFRQAGITSVAAVNLRGNAEAQGVLWIGRRGEERLDRYQIYLLQAIEPIIAARSEFLHHRKRLQTLQATDEVTDLPNEQQFQMMLRKMPGKDDKPWAMVLARMDQYGKYGQALPREQMDELMRVTGYDLRRTVRKSVFVARLGGPVFAMLCPETTPEQAKILAQRIQRVLSIHQVALPEGGTWKVTWSIGTGVHPIDGAQVDELLALVERRVERARSQGGHRIISEDAGGHRRAG